MGEMHERSQYRGEATNGGDSSPGIRESVSSHLDPSALRRRGWRTVRRVHVAVTFECQRDYLDSRFVTAFEASTTASHNRSSTNQHDGKLAETGAQCFYKGVQQSTIQQESTGGGGHRRSPWLSVTGRTSGFCGHDTHPHDESHLVVFDGVKRLWRLPRL